MILLLQLPLFKARRILTHFRDYVATGVPNSIFREAEERDRQEEEARAKAERDRQEAEARAKAVISTFSCKQVIK